jgi:hypothetical protein
VSFAGAVVLVLVRKPASSMTCMLAEPRRGRAEKYSPFRQRKPTCGERPYTPMPAKLVMIWFNMPVMDGCFDSNCSISVARRSRIVALCPGLSKS